MIAALRLLVPVLPLALAGCIDLPRPDPIGPGDPPLLVGVRSSAAGPIAALGSSTHEPGTPRLLYIHGTPGSSANWLDYLRDPVLGTESLAIDRPGFGDSGEVIRPRLLDQVNAVAPYLAIDRPNVIVGHSLGGPIAAWVAAEYPEHVSGLVLIAASCDPELESRDWYQYLGRAFALVVPEALVKANEEVWNLDDELRLLAPKLGQICCPVVLVHGTGDTLVPYGNVAFLRSALVNAASVEVVTFEGGDHFMLWRDRDEPRVRAAIASVVPSSGGATRDR